MGEVTLLMLYCGVGEAPRIVSGGVLFVRYSIIPSIPLRHQIGVGLHVPRSKERHTETVSLSWYEFNSYGHDVLTAEELPIWIQ